MPDSATLFGTERLVKVRGTIDGHLFRNSFMALGDGTYQLPVKSDVRKRMGTFHLGSVHGEPNRMWKRE